MSRIKPILFNTDMVRAILDGRKTATRRALKPQPPATSIMREIRNNSFGWSFWEDAGIWHMVQAPYYQGDILYVRETWNYGYIECSDIPESSEVWFEPVYKSDGHGSYIEALSHYFYKADEDAPGLDIGMVWRPSIHMPKEAARIWLKVTDVRVEQLQDIKEEQAKAEGCIDTRGFIRSPENEYMKLPHTAREQFAELWDSTIPLYGWNTNPWVWVIEFERCEKPEE